MKIVFATGNKNKLEEVREILGSKFEILSLADLDFHSDIPETANTIEGNAVLKAEFVWKKFGLACFADDTGLVVPALGGAPGVHSARYAGDNKSSSDNIIKILRELKNKEDRSAYFVSVFALIIDGELKIFEGRVDGQIIRELRGKGGFGYDPIFVPSGETLTFAELDSKAKNKISHRGRATRALAEYLSKY